MSPIELAAAGLTLLSVVLTVRRSLWLWPTGIVGTLLYGWVFFGAKLYFSTGLQVFFLVVQVYGWWFWMRGDKGDEPPIAMLGWPRAWGLLLLTAGASAGLGWLAGQVSDAHASIPDAALTGLSVVAQMLLSRKVLENWLLWIVTDVIAIGVYAGQSLAATAVLYMVLLGMACWGLWEWRRNFRAQGG